MDAEGMKLVNAAIRAYISVMGKDKWNALTAEQQHDAIMIMLTDLAKACGVAGQVNADLRRRGFPGI